MDADAARELIPRYDIVCDGTDNFATRFLLGDACHLLGRPLVSAAVLRFEGQLSVFPGITARRIPATAACTPEPPPEGLVPTCSEAGVLGAVTGVMGTLQATEVLKLILGIGETLAGRLLLWDALDMRFRTVRLKRDPDCALCGEAATITDLSAHDGAAAPLACAGAGVTVTAPAVGSGSPLGILLISGTHERAHYALVVAAGAAALGRDGHAVRHQRRLPAAARSLPAARGPARGGARRPRRGRHRHAAPAARDRHAPHRLRGGAAGRGAGGLPLAPGSRWRASPPSSPRWAPARS